MAVVPAQIVVKAGDKGTTYVSVTIKDANDTVILSHSGEPQGVNVSLSPINATLESGGSFDSVAEVSTNLYTQEGNYSIIISASGLSSHLNATVLLNMTIITSTNLVVTSLVISPSSPQENGEAEFLASVANRGYSTIYNIETQFILDTEILVTRFIDSIPAGQNASVSASWYNVTKGDHALAFIIDPEGLISMTSREDSTRTIDFGVEAQTFSVTVQIEGLDQGSTCVYVNDICQFSGSGFWSSEFDVGAIVSIRLDKDVTVSKDTMYHTDEYLWPQIHGTTTFSVHYRPMFHLDVDSQPADIVHVAGSGWYANGTSITLAAPWGEDIRSTVQLRFDHWSVGSQQISSSLMPYIVNSPAHVTACYDYFYKISLQSEYGELRIEPGICDQNVWCRNGTRLEWGLSDREVPAEGVWGTLEFKLHPNATSGNLIVTAPVVISVDWKFDWFSSVVGLIITLGTPSIIIAAVGGILWNRRKRRNAAPH